jgi:hypothetical protein
MNQQNEPEQLDPSDARRNVVLEKGRVVECELDLDDDTHVVVHRGTGRDVMRAHSMLTSELQGVPTGIFLALASLKCTFNGQRRTLEDLLEMDSDDVLLLVGLMMAGKDRKKMAATKDKTRKAVSQALGATSPPTTSDS